jgi:hypothetical protein
MRERQSNKSAHSIISGAAVGLGMGIVYCAWVGLLYAFRSHDSFEARGLQVKNLLLFYLVAGLACGAIVGGLRPWRSSLLGARVVGVIGMLPLAFGAEMLVKGDPRAWEAKHWILMVCFAAVIGVAMGGSFRTASTDQS